MAARRNYDYRKLVKLARAQILKDGAVNYKSLNTALGGVGVGTITKTLRKLASQGVVEKRPGGRQWDVLLNPDGSKKSALVEPPPVLPPPPASVAAKKPRRRRRVIRKKMPAEQANSPPSLDNVISDDEKVSTLNKLSEAIGGHVGEVLKSVLTDLKDIANVRRLRAASEQIIELLDPTSKAPSR